MASKPPTTIAAYIRAAPGVAQPHLRQLYSILKSVAPEAKEAIKWGTPFFVEPRFLFAFASHRAHCSLAPVPSALEVFREELKALKTTKGTIHFPYDQPIPEALVRRIAEYCVEHVRHRKDDAFW